MISLIEIDALPHPLYHRRTREAYQGRSPDSRSTYSPSLPSLDKQGPVTQYGISSRLQWRVRSRFPVDSVGNKLSHRPRDSLNAPEWIAKDRTHTLISCNICNVNTLDCQAITNPAMAGKGVISARWVKLLLVVLIEELGGRSTDKVTLSVIDAIVA